MIDIEIVPNSRRYDVISSLKGNANIGIELGVAEGHFSKRMIQSNKFEQFFGVDSYCDLQHDTEEYVNALRRVGVHSNYKLLRMRFDQAIQLFDDHTFDFIYVDGYAHSGQDGGETIFKWFKKLRVGGVMSGDDYHSHWPLVVEAVGEFVGQAGLRLFLTDKTEDDTYSLYPSWFVIKERDIQISPPTSMVRKGKLHSVQALKRRKRVERMNRMRGFARRILGTRDN